LHFVRAFTRLFRQIAHEDPSSDKISLL